MLSMARKTQQATGGRGRRSSRGKSSRKQKQHRGTKPSPEIRAEGSAAVRASVPSRKRDAAPTGASGVLADKSVKLDDSPTPQADWDSEVEVRFFSYEEELAPARWEEELAGAASEPAHAAEPLTREQLARRALYRRVVSRTVAALGVFAIGSVVARVAFGV